MQVRLPERFRLLTGQLFDLRVEATGFTDPSTARIQVLVNGANVASRLPSPEVTTDNDVDASDGDKAWTYRAYFPNEGIKSLQVTVSDGGGNGSATQRIGVQHFSFGANGALPRKNKPFPIHSSATTFDTRLWSGSPCEQSGAASFELSIRKDPDDAPPARLRPLQSAF